MNHDSVVTTLHIVWYMYNNIITDVVTGPFSPGTVESSSGSLNEPSVVFLWNMT